MSTVSPQVGFFSGDRAGGGSAAGARAPTLPDTLEATGLPEGFVVELLLKHLRAASELSVGALSRRVALPVPVIEPILEKMRTLVLVEVPRRGSFDAQVCYALTEGGKNRAHEAIEKNQFCGPAPVPLRQYHSRIVAQSARGSAVTSQRMRDALRGYVAPTQLVEQVGASLGSGRPIYLYGPSGSGKTYLAEHMVNVLAGTVWVPHALYVDDQVIQMFDPSVHLAVERESDGSRTLDRQRMDDARWIETRRPVVMAGGELTLDMLDLEFDPLTRFYSAPPQLRANNGMLVIDDLGRQRSSARDLMNRWIVPLDRNVDYLALHTGTKFLVPFDVQVVFSSNLAPMELADPAFIRRLGYKVYVGEMGESDYREVVRIASAKYGLAADDAIVDYLIHDLHRRRDVALLPSYPYDLLSKVRDRAMYHQEDPVVTVDALDWAWSLYFAADHEVREDV